MNSIILVFNVSVIIISIWSIICSNTTLKQRQTIPYERWKTVSFSKHQYYLMTFRNPMKLYHD